jgi:UDP-N-acetylmuramate dehydrogenase
LPYNALKKIENLEIVRDVCLAPLTTFRIGGRARLFLRPGTLGALERTVSFLSREGIAYKVLGRGSNLLISDSGVGVVMSLAALQTISGPFPPRSGTGRPTDRYVTVEAGCRLKSLLGWSIRSGLGGLECLTGIPASIGGAVAMNAGTAEGSIGEITDALLLCGPEGTGWVDAKELDFRYRGLKLPEKGIISAARLRLHPSPSQEIRSRMRVNLEWRLRTQPLGRPSAGSVFKNPPGDSAGRLIDICGLKGLTAGDAHVSNTHANFIVNLGNATCLQVLELMDIIKMRVKKETGVVLEPELAIWG